jgi:antitoxin MazE
MITTIQKWGNSLGVRLPKKLIDSLSFGEFDEVNISIEKNKIIISPTHELPNLKKILASIPKDYKPEKIDWGKDVGQENVW